MASDRLLRREPCEGPFAVIAQIKNADRLICLNTYAEEAGLCAGMGLSDARALYPNLRTCVQDIRKDQLFLQGLARWATRYCPWVGRDDQDGLLLNITGSAHLFGSEETIADDIRLRLKRSRLSVSIGIADTRGAAWALAHYGEGIAPVGQTLKATGALPVASLRITEQEDTTLQRLGIKRIGQLAELPRSTLGQRFGASVLMQLDRALGMQSESISPDVQPTTYSARLSLPDPIGLTKDVMAGIDRLLPPICSKLAEKEAGARVLNLTCRRVDKSDLIVELHLARPLRDPKRILLLFERGVNDLDAGFGIDQLRLEATQVESLPAEQVTQCRPNRQDGLHDLMTRLGNRIGLENILRFLPADSHIPEHSFIVAPAAWSEATGVWVAMSPRPIRMFRPEHIAANDRRPPRQFRWRRMAFTTARCTGPERIAPEWWLDDENWQHGVRDYWKVETREGRRLWMFYTPQHPGWYVQGEFA